MNDRPNKWDIRYQDAGESLPARVLLENRHLLPGSGEALDLACGLGANALLLAQHGLSTCAWDNSAVAIERLRARARALKVVLQAEVRDVVQCPPEPGRFDVIVVVHFLERKLAPQLIEALRDGGLLFYQTFTRAHVGDIGPNNPAYRLADQELLALFSSLRILVYREEGMIGDFDRGWRDEALLVGRKGR